MTEIDYFNDLVSAYGKYSKLEGPTLEFRFNENINIFEGRKYIAEERRLQGEWNTTKETTTQGHNPK